MVSIGIFKRKNGFKVKYIMKDPAVLFYTQDFITGTILMSDEQRGKYILLLCFQHQNGKLTERDMIKICGKKDEDIWAKFHQEERMFL